MKTAPKCQLCGGAMKKKTLGRNPLVALIVNLFLFFGGILLCFIPPLFIIGIPMILIALFRQNKRQKVLMCVQCRGTVARG